MKKIISLSIFLAGFTAMISQIVFMREFLIVFYGNELSIGFILASWLVGGAIGSLALGGAADRIKSKLAAFSLCQAAIAILLPLNILIIRSAKSMFNMVAGEIVSLFPMAVGTFLILVPLCAILGFMFSLACRIYQDKEEAQGAIKIGRVYILEAVGSMVGGVIASFVLIRFLDSVSIIGILSLLNILAAFVLILFARKSMLKPFLVLGLFIIMVLIILAWAYNSWHALDEYSLKRQWAGYELITSKNSSYGNITIARNREEISFFDNGLHLYTVPDEKSSEEAVHFALLEHPKPENILVIGGGVGGLIGQALKHPIKSVDYLELDPLIIWMATKYLPEADYAPLNDRRVSIENTDGRLFIKNSTKKYDCVIIDIGDPYTAQLNRYYTIEFFREVRKVLKENGIISFGLTSSESYINEELADFLCSIYGTLKKVFNDIKIIPGDRMYFLASADKGVLTYDYSVLERRAVERALDIKYIREYYLFSKMSPDKISYTEDMITKDEQAKTNFDFRPISYYYDTIFWTTHFRDSISKTIFKFVNRKLIWRTLFVLYLIIFLIGFTVKKEKQFFKKVTLVAVLTTGFSEIAFQVMVLIAFQVIYGYVFYKLGIIMTSFMIGLSLGSWCITEIMPGVKNDKKLFIWTQGAIVAYPLLLPIFFNWLALSRDGFVLWFGSNIAFPCLPVIAGFIGGFQFPLANKIYLEREGQVGRTAGLNYGMDLLGSCFAALLTGAFLVPILGITNTCTAVAMINFLVFILLSFSRLATAKVRPPKK